MSRLVVAIPNYNGAQNLRALVGQLLKSEPDAVYVLDDASTDNSQAVVEAIDSPVVRFIKGGRNLGPGGNRNRIIPYLKDEDLLLFVDADMSLVTTDLKGVLQQTFREHPKAGLVGGMVLTKTGKPMRFNYGHFSDSNRDRIGIAYEVSAQLLAFGSARNYLRKQAARYTPNLDIRYGRPRTHAVDWTSEALCCIKAPLFKKLGGFNQSLRYHEGQELAYRLKKAGFEVVFQPQLKGRHLEFAVRKHRARDFYEGRKFVQEQLEKSA